MMLILAVHRAAVLILQINSQPTPRMPHLVVAANWKEKGASP